MGKTRSIKLTIPIAFIFCLGLFGLTACSSCSDNESGCRINSDCAIGEICARGKCQASIPVDTGTVTESVDSNSDSASTGTVTDSDSDTGSASSTDSVSDTGEDTATASNCTDVPTQTSGQTCATSCDCVSGHCSNGFCCEEGLCCSQSGDCPASACGTQHCVSNTCAYSFSSFPCGTTTATGEQVCAGGNVCNGAGDCVPATQDCAPYAAITDEANCTMSPAQVVCYDGCSAANVAETCAKGNSCQNGKCVAPDAQPNGSACTSNNACLSGYCANGFCCDGGECCNLSVDCSDMCVSVSACSSNYQCTVVQHTGCGLTDTDGSETCSGDGLRCDGDGNCLGAEACPTENGLGLYSCGDGRIVENCGCESNDACHGGIDDFCGGHPLGAFGQRAHQSRTKTHQQPDNHHDDGHFDNRKAFL